MIFDWPLLSVTANVCVSPQSFCANAHALVRFNRDDRDHDVDKHAWDCTAPVHATAHPFIHVRHTYSKFVHSEPSRTFLHARQEPVQFQKMPKPPGWQAQQAVRRDWITFLAKGLGIDTELYTGPELVNQLARKMMEQAVRYSGFPSIGRPERGIAHNMAPKGRLSRVLAARSPCWGCPPLRRVNSCVACTHPRPRHNPRRGIDSTDRRYSLVL